MPQVVEEVPFDGEVHLGRRHSFLFHDPSVSRRHVLLKGLNTSGLSIEVVGKNPICILKTSERFELPPEKNETSGRNSSQLQIKCGEKLKVEFLQNGERRLLKEGDRFSLSITNPNFLLISVARKENQENTAIQWPLNGKNADKKTVYLILQDNPQVNPQSSAQTLVGMGEDREAAVDENMVFPEKSSEKAQSPFSFTAEQLSVTELPKDKAFKDTSIDIKGKGEKKSTSSVVPMGEVERDRDTYSAKSTDLSTEEAGIAEAVARRLRRKADRDLANRLQKESKSQGREGDEGIMSAMEKERKEREEPVNTMRDVSNDREPCFDPVKEFGFIVEGREFEMYEDRERNEDKEWTWRVKRAKDENGEDDDDIEENRSKGRRAHRKSLRDPEIDNEEWVPKADRGISQAKNQNEGVSGQSDVRKSGIKGFQVDDDENHNDDDEDDEDLEGFIVDEEEESEHDNLSDEDPEETE